MIFSIHLNLNVAVKMVACSLEMSEQTYDPTFTSRRVSFNFYCTVPHYDQNVYINTLTCLSVCIPGHEYQAAVKVA